jgi:hypothetical protein
MLGVQSQVVRGRGFSRVRGGVVNSLVAGTIRVLQAYTPDDIVGFAITFSAATIVDPISGFNVVDFDIPVTREFVVIRFVGAADFTPGLNDTFEFAFQLVPVML